jgi:hypothetical protein
MPPLEVWRRLNKPSKTGYGGLANMADKRGSPEAIAKRKAAIAAKKARQAGGVEDAIIYLRQAQTLVNERIASGKLKKRDPAHLLAELALMTLQGDI